MLYEWEPKIRLKESHLVDGNHFYFFTFTTKEYFIGDIEVSQQLAPGQLWGDGKKLDEFYQQLCEDDRAHGTYRNVLSSYTACREEKSELQNFHDGEWETRISRHFITRD